MIRAIGLACLSVILFLPFNKARAAVANPQVARTDGNHVVVSWRDKNPVAVYEVERPDTSLQGAKVVSQNNKDGRYLVAIPADRRRYFLLRDAIDQKTRIAAERALPLDRGSNFRDIGGYATTDGKHVRWGLIYRSGATPLLSAHDLKYIRSIGLKSMTDLRSVEERQLAPTRLSDLGIRYKALDYAFTQRLGDYNYTIEALAPEYRAIFRELLDGKGPVSYNCSAGQDRTGIMTALILAALGVPRQTILEDYHLSTIYRRPEYEFPKVDPAKFPGNSFAPLVAAPHSLTPPELYDASGRPFLAELLDEIDLKWGSMDEFLRRKMGVGPNERARLRALYLEP